jgi:hypothetical protein
MATIVIELHDTGIAAFDESGLVLPPDPGYALVDGEELATGHAALGHGRLKPRRVHHRFWDELDTTPLSRPFPRGLNRGDLAHAQLSRIWSTLRQRPTSAPSTRPTTAPLKRPASVPADGNSDTVILAVPGSFSTDQLSLILGIAKACEMPVVGMVDTAVAASAHGYPGARLLNLDLLLHRVVLTEMIQEDGEVARRPTSKRSKRRVWSSCSISGPNTSPISLSTRHDSTPSTPRPPSRASTTISLRPWPGSDGPTAPCW